jgi:hypothetical protein
VTDVETAPAAAVEGLPRAGRRRVLAVLCLTQISSWGILYYAFPVLSVSITAETGWSAPVITPAAFEQRIGHQQQRIPSHRPGSGARQCPVPAP